MTASCAAPCKRDTAWSIVNDWVEHGVCAALTAVNTAAALLGVVIQQGGCCAHQHVHDHGTRWIDVCVCVRMNVCVTVYMCVCVCVYVRRHTKINSAPATTNTATKTATVHKNSNSATETTPQTKPHTTHRRNKYASMCPHPSAVPNADPHQKLIAIHTALLCT